MATTMNGEVRTQRGGRVPANDFGDGCNDKEVRVACLGSDSEDSFVTASEGLEERDHSVLDCTAPLEGQAAPDLNWQLGNACGCSCGGNNMHGNRNVWKCGTCNLY